MSSDFSYEGPDWDQVFAEEPRPFTEKEKVLADLFDC